MQIYEPSPNSITPQISPEELIAKLEGKTTLDYFFATANNTPGRIALRSKTDEDDQNTDKFGNYELVTDDSQNTWREYTWGEYKNLALKFSSALTDLEVKDDERIMMLLRNVPAFHICDVGSMCHGATPVSIYHSSSPEQILYLIEHSEASVIIVENPAFAERIAVIAKDIPRIKHLIMLEDPETLSSGIKTKIVAANIQIHYLKVLLENALPVDEKIALNSTTQDDLATIIYTSGTTGTPKGVALTQRNISSTVESLYTVAGLDLDAYKVVSYLPMAHIAERMVSHYIGMRFGWTLTCCPDATLVSQYLGPTRPDALFAVPRIWEKAYATINAFIAKDMREEFGKALVKGSEIADMRANGIDIPKETLDEFAQVDAKLLAPWRALLGLDNCKVAVSGAAPLPVEILTFFRGLGIPVSEIYGLSETCGPLTWSPNAQRNGFVGEPIPGEEVALADDGEVLVRGANIFSEYLKDEEKTSEAIDGDGWFHTGDIGIFDDGQLKIVDRKKELIITAGGKNVSPANLEAHLKTSPYIFNAFVVGDGQKYLGALIILDPEALDFFAGMNGLSGKDATFAELSKHAGIKAEVEKAVETANSHVSSAESIRKFFILDHEWLPDSDVLTPTMKLKRKIVNEKYANEIASMF
ncbi:MAG: AMP-binding protein [Acidimicrobiia bacterium]|nr:AMP-binding protein [Acidimicrobiia bacterium]